jgi:hypothetical protein
MDDRREENDEGDLGKLHEDDHQERNEWGLSEAELQLRRPPNEWLDGAFGGEFLRVGLRGEPLESGDAKDELDIQE